MAIIGLSDQCKQVVATRYRNNIWDWNVTLEVMAVLALDLVGVFL